MIKKSKKISMSKQCELLSIHRSGLYYKPVPERAENLSLMRLMDEQYLKTPFYGKAKLTAWLNGKGRAIDNIFIERLWRSVKYECVYLHAFEDGIILYKGLREYFRFYNHERIHQSLDYKTPAQEYLNAA